MPEQIPIDEKYTYEFDKGQVRILRLGSPWLESPEADKAWISAANQLARLRRQVHQLEHRLEQQS